MRAGYAVLVVAALWTAGACTAEHHTDNATPAVLHVTAIVGSTHLDAHGVQRTYETPLPAAMPLPSPSVIVTAAGGHRQSFPVDAAGSAVVRVPPGRYVVTTSFQDVCYASRVTLRSGANRPLALNCEFP